MKLFLYCGDHAVKEDVDNIRNKLEKKGHTICASFSDCELILSLGGDGTLLKAAQIAIEADKPLAGINCGRLGYLCVLKQEQIDDFDEIIAGCLESEKPLMVCQLNGREHYAVNDFAVGKSSFGRTADLSLQVSGQFRYKTRCDGLVVCTPVGSSAYNLAAFGPLLDGDTETFVITPICSHTKGIYPIVISNRREVTITVNRDEAGVYADGEYIGSIADSVTIVKSQKTLRLLERA